ncbi:NADH:flavin oxidoreductase [Bengtsoniella intestinalis]|uniref:oxidoreductase n=1 Tax=Bengtsoniella intestinalis TaxID=3073143 RepID=UPI00391F30B8
MANRICVPPMVCYHFTDDSGYVVEKNINHYGSIAKGGFGLVIVEATAIDKSGRLSHDQLGLWEDGQIQGHSQIAACVHQENVPVVVQIHHAGVMGCAEEVVSSSVCTVNNKTARALTLEEIETIESQFVAAAKRAEQAGYDGVEIHGAHNYLLTQFLNSRVNQRTDAYGEDKLLIVKNVIQKIRACTKDDFIVGIRMGAYEPTIDQGIAHAKVFESLGFDYLNVSFGFSFQMDDPTPADYEFSPHVYGASQIAPHVNIPVFGVNQITNPAQAQAILTQGDLDMVCIGRGVLVNYNWANDAKANQDVGKCLYCPKCYWRIPMADCAGRRLYHKNKS